MQTIDLYSGHEGYAGVTLTEESTSNQVLFKVQLLSFHFDEILSLIPLGQYDLDSVMNNYFKVEGWHDGKWECKRIQEFYDQLTSISSLMPSTYTNAHEALKQICSSALQNSNKLFIVEDL